MKSQQSTANGQQPIANSQPRLVERRFLLPFVAITTLFALWGFANDITNPMVAAFQTLMELPAAKASLIQFAFYGGYATMAIPAALFIRKYSYKSGILLGLALYAIGAFLFIPAAAQQSFTFFCFSLYILTFGLAFLGIREMPPDVSTSHRLSTRLARWQEWRLPRLLCCRICCQTSGMLRAISSSPC